MPIGDWIREANERRRQRIREEALAEGRKEGYQIGYADGSRGKPMQDLSENSEQSSC